MISELLEGLNEEQKIAVTHKSGPLLILAGAGSGKTRVLTHRTAWLINERGVKPSEIALLTFTNKAAAEMKERVAKIGNNRLTIGFAGTFHTFCAKLLRSYGYNVGDFIYDKDSGTPIMITCEMATYYKQKGMTLVDALEDLYKKHGYYLEDQLSPVFEGEAGVAKIEGIMKKLRENPIKTLGGYKLTNIVDYSKGHDHLPPSDVLKMEFGDRLTIYGRPSGTEPKVKFYFMIMNMENLASAKTLLEKVKTEFSEFLNSIE